jgi:hypothetical protein
MTHAAKSICIGFIAPRASHQAYGETKLIEACVLVKLTRDHTGKPKAQKASEQHQRLRQTPIAQCKANLT